MDITKPVKRFVDKLTGESKKFDLSPFEDLVEAIESAGEKMANLPDKELKVMAEAITRSVQEGGGADDEQLVQAFALVREVCWRQLEMKPFRVQLIAAIALYQGKLAEMKTGEGKTLAAVMPVFLKAVEGKGVHVLTFNDYLARRDALWMGPVYEFLGLSVGYIQAGMTPQAKKEAYECDITYATAKMVGFDYLRSYIAYDANELLLRPFHYAIVDEADAILIDEARNPLVLAGNISESVVNVREIAAFVEKLEREKHYSHDEHGRNIFLTEAGINFVEGHFGVKNLHDKRNFDLLTAVNLGIHARELLHRDVDYVIKDGQIRLIDLYTGRIVADRKWQNGLQMAVEAKEGLKIQSEGVILGSISLQHFMHCYPKIAGMTATALQSAEEFANFYGLEVIIIPPNLPCRRIDHADLIFSDKDAKIAALIQEVKKVHQTGRPMLIGTSTVRESEELASLLIKAGIKPQVLNARHDEREAEIVARAGTLGAITISTNMAGRGTDILLGGPEATHRAKILELGGLYVIGTNRHESKRIDDQLRGRAGRQGDPGSSRFFTSLEDDLMEKYQLKSLFPKNYPFKQQQTPLSEKVVVKVIVHAHRVIEGQMYEIRKTLFQYSTFVEKQRKLIQGERQGVLFRSQGTSNNDLEALILNQYDKAWAKHLAFVQQTRESIHLVRLGGQNPLQVFHEQVKDHFTLIQEELEQNIAEIIRQHDAGLVEQRLEKPSSTWTYIINDNPFKDQLGMMLLSNANIGFQADVFTIPVLFFLGVFRRWRHRRSRGKDFT